MLPPVEPSTLEQNPQFASLYKHLTSQLIGPDGKTRSVASHPGRKAVETVSVSGHLQSRQKII